MRKKLQILMILFIASFSLIACQNEITIGVDDESITLTEGDTYQIDVVTNDTLGIDFLSNDSTVLTIDEDGLITALSEGNTSITLTSKQDENIQVTILVTVLKLYTITSQYSSFDVLEGDEVEIVYEANDDVTFLSSDPSIFTVDESGIVTGIKEGEANLTITSVGNDQVSLVITIHVTKIIVIEVDQTEEALWVQSTVQIDYESNDDVEFISSNTEIATVSQTGLITGIAQGTATITLQSVADNDIKKEITVDVYLPTEMILIEGDETINLDSENQLLISAGPDMAYPFVTWESSNNDIASIDQNGLLTANSVGVVTITASSLYDENLTATLAIEVVNYLLVNLTSEQNDTLDFMDISFSFGSDLFNSIQDAIDSASPGVTVFVQEGTYTENIDIDQNNLKLIGSLGAILQGEIDVQADDVLIENFEFSQAARIKNTIEISNFEFKLNTVNNSTLASYPFLSIVGITGVKVSENTFTNLLVDAISIEDFLGGEIVVEKNLITNVQGAIVIDAQTEYDDETVIHVVRNDIDGATVALHINLLYGENQKSIEAYARFNSVVNYSISAVSSNVGNEIDLTCNYWGTTTPDPLKFVNVDPAYYRGFYSEKADIISESVYNPILPALFEITNPIYELIIGDTYTFTFDAFPLDIVDPKYKWITSDPTVLLPNTTGTVTPLKSGIATLTLRSSVDIRISTTITVTVITTPGIEITTSNVDNNVIVGDSITLTATPFPFNIKDDVVTFTSSDPSIATIDELGVVTTLQAGNVTFTASLLDDSQVATTFTLDIYDALDENDLLDLLTMNQVSYSLQHTWTAFGTAFNYVNFKNESVSKYYFDQIDVNTSKIVPVSTGIRPGEPMTPLPDGVTQYNPYDVYWIVIHDTANTSPGAGALSHANYLWNLAAAGSQPYVSWHFTIDDTYLYQSLPEIERGYHAGDGSTLPLQGTTYLGGGNRNGIGIEMAINQDGDMYRTWQRTAKFSASLLVKYNLPRENSRYHVDFSGKNCPNSLRTAGLIPLFEEFLDIEFRIQSEFSDAEITFETNDPEYLDQTGRIIKMPDRPMTVSYTITVTENGIERSRTFFTYLPGTVH
ncbi:MAG: Ig-like domain-containing protein [Acholeplasmataceae bacterium]|nr:Ig-like domain-containing protein [Acholeplasmataceae bacterium]